MKTIPVVICVDVEPLAREVALTASKDWEGFEETALLLSAMRPRLQAATGAPVHYSWFLRMDPQVAHTYGTPSWVTQRYAGILAELEQAGDEIGLHAHAWRWDVAAGHWIVDHGNQRWVDHCIESSFEAYQQAFGRPCRSFRFGDHWMNDHTMRLLESLGVQVDLTVEPGIKAKAALVTEEAHTGSLPDYTTTPRWPYRPSIKDFRKQTLSQRRSLWIVPLSTARRGLGRFPALKRAALALGLDMHKQYEPTPLYLGHEPQTFEAMADNLLSVWRKPYLAPVTRSDCAFDARGKDNMEQNLTFLMAHPQIDKFEFVTPDKAVKLLS